jgi:plasmid stabilization system protein ParE
MKILLKDTFLNRLDNQTDFIAIDSPKSARKFKKEILHAINKIIDNPRSCRKSIYFDDETIRDLIFKGYTIVFKINTENIEVFGFVKYQNNVVD